MYLDSGKNSSASYNFKGGGAFTSFTNISFNDFTYLPIYFSILFSPIFVHERKFLILILIEENRVVTLMRHIWIYDKKWIR